MLGVIYRQASSARHALSTTASRLRDAATVALLLAVGLPGFTASAVQAGDVLTLDGARLEPMLVATGVPADIRRVVTLNGDVPLVTHATARSVSGANFVRTRQGYWLPWSGRAEDLLDAGFQAQSGSIEFKLLKEDLPRAQLPITVSIGYRAASGIKFGTFEIRAQ
jgi:hypothetical protein